MQVLDLEKLFMERDIAPESLAEIYGFRMTRSGKVALVKTVPKTVAFYGTDFFGTFIFSEDVLKRVELSPIIKNVVVPNYPSEEYQQTKVLYCETFLREIFGNKPTSFANGIQWTTDRYTIGCYAINEGKDKYTGGNIAIDMRSDF